MQNVEERAKSCRNLERWGLAKCGIHAEEERMRPFNRVKRNKQKKTLLQSSSRWGGCDYIVTVCACMPMWEDRKMAQQRQKTLQNVWTVRHFWTWSSNAYLLPLCSWIELLEKLESGSSSRVSFSWFLIYPIGSSGKHFLWKKRGRCFSLQIQFVSSVM